jgi:hypothetical protein
MRCAACSTEKPLDEFYFRKKEGRHMGYCKSCTAKRSKRSREKLGRRHRKNIELQRNYGITIEDYDRMYAEQGGRCVCGAKTSRAKSEFLFVDHCHKTGQVRGLLCNRCNRAIGLVEDPMKLQELADYLVEANKKAPHRRSLKLDLDKNVSPRMVRRVLLRLFGR